MQSTIPCKGAVEQLKWLGAAVESMEGPNEVINLFKKKKYENVS